MEVGWFDEPAHSSGSIGARLSTDATIMHALVGEILGLLVHNIASAVAGLVIAFTTSWQPAFIVLALLPLIGISGHIQIEFIKGCGVEAKTMYKEANQVATDAVGSKRTVASFCAEEKVMELYRKKCEGPLKTGIRQGLISGTGYGLSFFFLFSFYATSFYVGAQLVAHQKATFSDVFQVFFALTFAAFGISQTSSLLPDTGKAKIAAASIFAIIDRKSKMDPSDESRTILDSVKGDIELLHISFKYPLRPEIQIFQDLSLSICVGKVIDKRNFKRLKFFEGIS
ncbi:hypothetical protein SLA2020_064900 [Shorea laevis]